MVYVSASSHTVQYESHGKYTTSIPCLINKIKCICILLVLGRNTMSNVDNQAAFYKYCIHPTEG